MTALPESSGLLILPRLRIQNANTISSPLTHGFPSITAFLGLMWALERKLADRYPIGFDSIGVVCHHHEAQTIKSGYQLRFALRRPSVVTRKEATKFEKGELPAIVEEGRIHLDITLIFGVSVFGESHDVVGEDESVRAEFAHFVWNTVAQLRVAGGTVLPHSPGDRWLRPHLERVPDDATDAGKRFRSLRRRWLPGFALVCRDDLLAQHLERLRITNPSANQLDAWLDLSRFNWTPHRVEHRDEKTGEITRTSIEWDHDRTEGWIVPIPVGYGALSELYAPGTVANARDSHTPFRFVESLYSIGQWISPHRLGSWRELLWYGHSDPDSGLYRACNDYAAVQH